MPTTQPKRKRATKGRNRLGQFVNSPGPGRKKGVPKRRLQKFVDRRETGRKGRGLKKAPVRATEVVRRSNTLVHRLKPKETRAEASAAMVVSGLASNAVTSVRFSKFPLGDVDLTECLVKLHAAVDRVHRGDLREAEALLTAQAVTLNTMFTHLANRADKTEYVDKFDRYLRLALKAQAQCRATLERLAAIKNPPTLLARQANIAHGPQQVNNTVSPERRDAQPPMRSGKLYEPHNAIFLVSYIDTSDFLEVLRGIEAVHTGAPELREILDLR